MMPKTLTELLATTNFAVPVDYKLAAMLDAAGIGLDDERPSRVLASVIIAGNGDEYSDADWSRVCEIITDLRFVLSRHQIASASTLDELFEGLATAQILCRADGDTMATVSDPARLPKFGGDDLTGDGIYSWDGTRVITTDVAGTFILVDRPELEAANDAPAA